MWYCSGIQKRLEAYLDGELSQWSRRRIAEHLKKCQACQRACDELQGIGSMLKHIDQPPPVPEGLYTQIMDRAALEIQPTALEQKNKFYMGQFLFSPRLVTGATAAALVVGLTMGSWMGWAIRRSPMFEPYGAVIMKNEKAEMFYEFDVLGAAPQGSIEAAALALLGGEK